MIKVQDAVTKMRHMCRLMDVYCQQSDELKEGVGCAVTHREFVQQAFDVSGGSMVAEEVLKDATLRVSKATGEVAIKVAIKVSRPHFFLFSALHLITQCH